MREDEWVWGRELIELGEHDYLTLQVIYDALDRIGIAQHAEPARVYGHPDVLLPLAGTGLDRTGLGVEAGFVVWDMVWICRRDIPKHLVLVTAPRGDAFTCESGP